MSDVTYDEMCSLVLNLPPLYRAMLANHLLNSIDDIAPSVESAWNTEIAQRIKDIDQETVTLIPANDVLQNLRNRP
ncbi:MAG: addiction module protein [Cyanobacteria bacterium P01_F01_bin.150]